jgi:hypothetical protein
MAQIAGDEVSNLLDEGLLDGQRSGRFDATLREMNTHLRLLDFVRLVPTFLFLRNAATSAGS